MYGRYCWIWESMIGQDLIANQIQKNLILSAEDKQILSSSRESKYDMVYLQRITLGGGGGRGAYYNHSLVTDVFCRLSRLCKTFCILALDLHCNRH